MTGVDDVREAVRGATIVAFPQSSRTGEKPPAAAAGQAGGEGREPPAGDATPDDPDIPFALMPQTDLGNAERFAERYREMLRYCPAIGWLWWDGRRWSRDGADEHVKLAEHTTVRAIQDEADALARSRNDFRVGGTQAAPIMLSDRLRKWGRASEAINKISAMSKRASAMLAIAIEALDRDPMKVCVLNGTLHVGREVPDGYVALRPHDPSDYITRLAPVVYDPAALCPIYDRFLDEIHPGTIDAAGLERRATQVFLHQWFGYSLTGDTSAQKMVFLYGKGRNGKGVLVNIVAHVCGDYADSIPIESFLDSGRARAGGQATPDIAGLPGVRMLGTSEPKKGATLDEAFVKLFTGGDRIKARHLNKDFFAFTPHAKLTMQGNYRPKISGADEGIWGRIILVPCLVFIPPERRDLKLFDKLKGETSGILNRLLDGLRHWLDDGLVLPDTVREATEQYRTDSDPLGRFLEACVAQRAGARVQATEMHLVFTAWCKANGETVWTIKGLGSALRERGLAVLKSSQAYWCDVELTKTVHDFDAAPSGSGSDGERWERVDDP